MIVLQINVVNNIKSTGRICTELANYINNLDGTGIVAYSYGPSVNVENEYVIGTKIEKKLHAFGSRLLGKQAYYSKKGTTDLINYIEKIGPNIIHLHNLHGNYINLGMLLKYCAKKDIPTVLTLHDCWFFTGKCTHYTVDDCYKWKNECGECIRLRKDNKSWFFDRTQIMLEDKKKWFQNIPRLAVVGVSDWITNEARKSILSSAKSITRIYNWVDFYTFKPIYNNGIKEQLGISDKFVLLGVASEWTNRKGLSDFIELSSRLQGDETIVLIGYIDSRVKLPSNVIHINETHNAKKLAEYYSMADIFFKSFKRGVLWKSNS